MSSGKCISPEKFTTEDLCFGDLREGKLPGEKSYERIPISVKHPDGSTGPLIIVTEPCFSFGIQEDKKYGNFTIPLSLYDKGKPTLKQKMFVRTINKIITACDKEPKSCF